MAAIPSVRRGSIRRRSGDPFNLVLDDGGRDNAIGLTAGGKLIRLNRASPVEFPIQLTNVLVFFGSEDGMLVGETFDVYLHADTDGDGDPGTGATHIGGQTGNAIVALDAWTDIVLAVPAEFLGPGNVLVAVVNRRAGVVSATFAAALDQTATQARS